MEAKERVARGRTWRDADGVDVPVRRLCGQWVVLFSVSHQPRSPCHRVTDSPTRGKRRFYSLFLVLIVAHEASGPNVTPDVLSSLVWMTPFSGSFHRSPVFPRPDKEDLSVLRVGSRGQERREGSGDAGLRSSLVDSGENTSMFDRAEGVARLCRSI